MAKSQTTGLEDLEKAADNDAARAAVPPAATPKPLFNAGTVSSPAAEPTPNETTPPTPLAPAEKPAGAVPLPSPAPAKVEKVQEEEKVLVSARVLKDIFARLDAVENQGSNKPALDGEEEAAPEKPKVTVRFIDGDVVIGYGKSWEKKDPSGSRFLGIQVFTGGKDGKGEKKLHEKEYIQFREFGDYEIGHIIDIKKAPTVANLGKIRVKKLDYDKFQAFETSKTVDLKVTGYQFTYTVQMDDGRVFELPEQALN